MKYEILRVENLCKKFDNRPILDKVSFDVYKGEIHVILGGSGAGKSVLANILSGIDQTDGGKIYFEGKNVGIESYQKAKRLGISFIRQEISLIPNLNVYENLFIGREIKRNFWFVDKRQSYQYADELIKTMGFLIDPATPVRELSVSQKRMIEIIKAVSCNGKLIVMDEPISSASGADVELFKNILRKLTSQGTSILYLTRGMEEISELVDRLTMLEDGRITFKHRDQKHSKGFIPGNFRLKEQEGFSPTKAAIGDEILRVEGLATPQLFKSLSFGVGSGEILGITGGVGSGYAELARALFGLEKKSRGRILVENSMKNIRKPGDAIRAGIALIAGDGVIDELMMPMSVQDNITLPVLKKMSMGPFLNKKAQSIITEDYIQDLEIKAGGAAEKISALSRLDKLKIILSRYLITKPKILVFHEITKGMNPQTKQEVYHLIHELARKGLAVIFSSHDFQEVSLLCNRMIVMDKAVSAVK